MATLIRVFIADDNRLLREGLASMLDEIKDMNSCRHGLQW